MGLADRFPYLPSPIHLGVTEAGNGLEGRVKSAVGIGALLADGIGDTIRVSLTEAPENEIPVAQLLADHFRSREGRFEVRRPERYSPTEYRRRSTVQTPLVHREFPAGFRELEALSANPTAELRAAILDLDDREPVAVCRRYEDASAETVAVKAAADLGLLFLDGLADGIRIVAPRLAEAEIERIELAILQAARARMSRTEYIACPGCGRTLYDLERTLERIEARTSHLRNLRIGVMGCIVNGPGEMADADYGYVGAASGRITLYKGREIVERNIPQEEALDRLVALIKANGDWREPEEGPDAVAPAKSEDRTAGGSAGGDVPAAERSAAGGCDPAADSAADSAGAVVPLSAGGAVSGRSVPSRPPAPAERGARASETGAGRSAEAPAKETTGTEG